MHKVQLVQALNVCERVLAELIEPRLPRPPVILRLPILCKLLKSANTSTSGWRLSIVDTKGRQLHHLEVAQFGAIHPALVRSHLELIWPACVLKTGIEVFKLTLCNVHMKFCWLMNGCAVLCTTPLHNILMYPRSATYLANCQHGLCQHDDVLESGEHLPLPVVPRGFELLFIPICTTASTLLSCCANCDCFVRCLPLAVIQTLSPLRVQAVPTALLPERSIGKPTKTDKDPSYLVGPLSSNPNPHARSHM